MCVFGCGALMLHSFFSSLSYVFYVDNIYTLRGSHALTQAWPMGSVSVKNALASDPDGLTC